MERPTIGIWSDPNALSLALVEKLLANVCNVLVFSREENAWKEKTSHISGSSHFLIKEKEDEARSVDYCLVIDIIGKINFEETLNNAVKIEEKHQAKTFLILNYRDQAGLSNGTRISENLGIIYLGDLFGPRMDLEENRPLSRIIHDTLLKKAVRVSEREIIFPVPIAEASILITRWLFSFGPYGEEITILSPAISTKDFYGEITRVVSNTNFILKEERNQKLPRNVSRYILKPDLYARLTETFEWFLKYQPLKPKDIIYEKKKDRPINIWPFAALFLFVLFLPFLFIGISAVSLIFAWDATNSGRYQMAKTALSTGEVSSQISNKEAMLLAPIPVLGEIYKPMVFFSEASLEVTGVGQEGLVVLDYSKELFAKISGNEVYNPVPYANKISLSLDRIYQKLSFLQSEIEGGSPLEKKIIYRFSETSEINNARELVGELKSIVSLSPEILGINKKKTYLVLLQNNMELRPTGGFIGSYALVTFEGGKISDINVSDVYSADGQLKGHIDPPEPIRKYLGEGGWYMRDANWDPDFPTSANKIEWFLDKEIDQSVDGVISIDLDVAKLMLKETGPINLSDFGVTIDSANLYEKTQAEVQDNFFPGSQKKSSFLTAMTRSLFDKISTPGKGDYAGLAKAILLALEGRHMQIFLHNGSIQKSIENLGWNGGVISPSCAGNCYSDWFGIVEANLGVNKANYFINRKATFEVYFEGNTIRRKLTLNLINEANIGLDKEGKYKAYVRLITPVSSTLGSVLVSGGGRNLSLPQEINVVHGRKEGGVYVEVEPNQSTQLVYTWIDSNNLDFRKNGKYLIYWRKQAGTDSDPISVIMHLPNGVIGYGEPLPSLTRGGNFGYNTFLVKDFVAKISW